MDNKQPERKKTGPNRSGKKRRAARVRRIRRAVIAIFVLAVVAVTALLLTNAVIDRRLYPLSAQAIDLRDHGLTGVGQIARLTGLNKALLSGNQLTDVSALSALKNCEYIDLTGNPVSAQSYAQLKEALPGCLILCEAEDGTTQELVLGGYDLPDAEALARVFESHSALRTVDLRGTSLSQADADLLRTRFPRINFIYSAGQSANTVMLELDSADKAMGALLRLSDPLHVTITGCTFTPEQYHILQSQFPKTDLDCLLSLNGQIIPSAADYIDLSGAVLDDALAESLSSLAALTQMTIGETLPSEAARLKETLGLTQLIYTYNGILIAPETAQLDLRGAENLTADELSCLIDALPALDRVSLDAPDEEMLAVIRRHRDDVLFVYEIEAFGRTFETTAETIDLDDDVTNNNIDQLTGLLNQLPLLKEANMYKSKLSQANMDMLFDAYPDVFFGWTFTMCDKKYTVRTDITAFSTQLGSPIHKFDQDDFTQLRYCKKLLALDLGHNAITDIEFVKNFPNLRLLILADNRIKDVSPLAVLTELEYLEIFMNPNISDFSPISGLPLKHLNVRNPKDDDAVRLTADAFTGIASLQRFWGTDRQLSEGEVERLREALPGCQISVTGETSTGDGWRETEHFDIIVRMFDNRVYEPFP